MRHKDYNQRNQHERDKLLTFEPIEHIYYYGSQPLRSVSQVVSSFFEDFDSNYWSAHIARKTGRSQADILAEWEEKGARSRDAGTFMHEQIERHFLGLAIESDFTFSHKTICEQMSIDRELSYFLSLCQKEELLREGIPYRTEWRIFDEELGIAGTIDCLMRRSDGSYVMVDWKRSEKIGKETSLGLVAQTKDPWNKKGVGPLSHIHDTSYNRYCLQQNLYAHILRRRYGIEVCAMYLAVISPNYQRAYLIPVVDMGREVASIQAI